MSTTPLTDFLATLADPDTLVRFREDQDALMAAADLPADLVALIKQGNRGAIRVAAVRELENAGLSPVVSDQFGEGDDQSFELNITINTNNYNTNQINVSMAVTTNNYNIDTYTISTTTDTTTTDTTTTTHQSAGPDDWTIATILDESLNYFVRERTDRPGELTIVGTGIRAITDMTLGAEAQVKVADKVFYCVADPVIERRLHALTPSAESLYGLYANDKPRETTYREMVDAMLAPVRAGQRVCGVFYGHPGVFAWPTHVAIRTARSEGYRAEMQPGVSAEDSLFADLGIDPSRPGLHSMEATDLLVRARVPDVASHVLIWQAECVGDMGFNFAGYSRSNFGTLVEYLLQHYPADHPVLVYEAAALPQGVPHIERTTLEALSADKLTGISTLYLPPTITLPIDADMCARLGL